MLLKICTVNALKMEINVSGDDTVTYVTKEETFESYASKRRNQNVSGRYLETIYASMETTYLIRQPFVDEGKREK